LRGEAKLKKFLSIAITLLSCAFPQIAASQEMQPGLYDSTTALEMTDGKKQTNQDQDCITAKDIADGLTKIGIESDTDCKVQDLVKGSSKITYRMVCADGGKKLVSDVVGTFTASSYDFTIKPASAGALFKSINVKGKRLGVCK
jgi:Protein of unknown function (DUF3617)